MMTASRFTMLALVCMLLVVSAAIPASAERLYTTGDADGIQCLDMGWYGDSITNAPTLRATVSPWYNGDTYVDSYTWAIVQMPIASLQGRTFQPGDITLRFYSFGMTNVELQALDMNGSGTGCAFWWMYRPTTQVCMLNNTAGWVGVDVTANVVQHLAKGYTYSAFRFYANRSPGGQLAAWEDPQGRGAYLDVVPEPTSLLALGSGLLGLIALRRRRS